jgi:hypothetical protein
VNSSAARPTTAGPVRFVVAMEDVDPALVQALAQGAYVVDPRAVADAIVKRHADLLEAQRLSRMLVSAQIDRPPVLPEQHEPAAGADVA